MKFTSFTSLIVASCCLARLVDGYPGGAAVCLAGSISPLGPHTGSLKGILSNGDYQVSLGGSPLSSGALLTPIAPGDTKKLKVEGLNSTTFRGFLIRLSNSESGFSVAGSLEESSDEVQIMESTGELAGRFPNAGSCDELVAGATHTSRDLKTSVEVELTLPSNVTIGSITKLEITVLQEKTAFYFNSFDLTVVEATSNPTGSPTVVPNITLATPGPSASPTSRPSTAPTLRPSAAPSQAPTTAPTPAPTESGTSLTIDIPPDLFEKLQEFFQFLADTFGDLTELPFDLP